MAAAGHSQTLSEVAVAALIGESLIGDPSCTEPDFFLLQLTVCECACVRQGSRLEQHASNTRRLFELGKLGEELSHHALELC